jgi:hypothetical protein
MNKLAKTLLVASVVLFVAGCSSQKAAPAQEPVFVPAAPAADAGMKHKHRHHHDKLGKTHFQKDVKK